jgi:hypothetical protein
MFITKRHLSRRTVLRGMGATVFLPLLDSMVPARTALADTAARPLSRLACIEIVHGAAGSTMDGTGKHYWSPATDGSNFEMPETLASFADQRDYMTIVTGTDLRGAEAATPAEEGGDHLRASAAYLSAAHPKRTEGADIFDGTSIDQLYAQRFGQDTPLPSIQYCIEAEDASGSCDFGYACVYSDTISWSSPTTPLPMTPDPRSAFEDLFGDGATAKERLQRQIVDTSILDSIGEKVKSLQKDLGASDQSRMNDYLENVREIERRIQHIEKYNASGEARALPAAPLGVPDNYDAHVKLMYDLQVLAFMTDVTRVSSFKMSRDVNMRVFPESGVTTPFHSCSHHGELPSHVAEYAKINQYHASLVSYFVDKLKNTPDGDGNLLDHSLVLYGSPMGDSNVHNHHRIPVLLLGHANGAVRGNNHVRVADGTPFSNVLLTMTNKLGMNMKSLGDSTGMITI